jgi:hypothetical protein
METTNSFVNVAWLSRHPMTADQKADLAKTLGLPEETLAVETINRTWSASADPEKDRAENRASFNALYASHEVITGVFPPVALEAMSGSDIYSPVSEQTSEARADGTRQIAFKHLRWAKIRL